MRVLEVGLGCPSGKRSAIGSGNAELDATVDVRSTSRDRFLNVIFRVAMFEQDCFASFGCALPGAGVATRLAVGCWG